MIRDVAAIERMKVGLTETELMQLDMEFRNQRRDKGTLMGLACLGFIGVAGIHRFMLGQTGMGILYLLTGGLCWIGTIIDLTKMASVVDEYNYDLEFRMTQEFIVRKHAREGTS